MYLEWLRDDWQITCWYLVMLALIVIVAKIASIRAVSTGKRVGLLSFVLAPSLCVNSWANRGKLRRDQAQKFVIRALVILSLIVLVYLFVTPTIRHYPWWLQSYLAIVPFWLLLETIDVLCQILWLPTGRLTPAVNNRPWRAKSVSEFWGRRWNRLFGDWLRQVVFMALRRRPKLALVVTFLVSGLLHELLVSLPLQMVYGQSIWGWLTGYFMIQYLAVLLERRLFFVLPVVQRVFLWLAVLGPAPLVLNPGTLLIFHLGG